MTKEQAEQLAKHDRNYRARNIRGQWVVWCDKSDHCVEFDREEIERVGNAIAWGVQRQ